MSEFEFIAKLGSLFPNTGSPEFLGIGDDCALFPGTKAGRCISVDAFVEGVHFKRQLSSWQDIGWKALAVSLSDIAAMGASADLAVINLQLPKDLAEELVLKIYSGLAECADCFGVKILGGNTSSASELSISTTVIGSVSQQAILRSGMKPGDDIWVTGAIGESFVGWQALESQKQDSVAAACIERYLKPMPQLELVSRLIGAGTISSMIDISDGLFQDLSHLCEASACSAEISLESIPHPSVSLDLGLKECEDLRKLFTGGGDYQLLFSTAESDRGSFEAFSELRRIGSALPSESKEKGRIRLLTKDSGLVSLNEFLGQQAAGYQHMFS